MDALCTVPADKLYADTEALLIRLTANFTASINRRHEFDDYRSLANSSWAKAYRTWDESGAAAFSTWLWRIVRNDFLKYYEFAKRRDNVHGYKFTDVCPDGDSSFLEPESGEDFDLDVVTDQLSPDAQFVVHLVFDLPSDLLTSIVMKGGTGVNHRSSIREYLQHQVGWSRRHVTSIFSEIRTIINL